VNLGKRKINQKMGVFCKCLVINYRAFFIFVQIVFDFYTALFILKENTRFFALFLFESALQEAHPRF